MTPDCEADLIQRAQAGDSAAEDTLVRQFEPLHRSLSRNYTHSQPARYADACQAARIGTLMAIRKFDPEHGASLGAYVSKFAQGYVQMDLRRVNSALLASSTEWDGVEEPSSDNLEASVIGEQLTERVQTAIAEADMDPTDAAIVAHRLAAEEPETLAEVGARVGLCRETIRQREIKLTQTTLPKLLASLR